MSERGQMTSLHFEAGTLVVKEDSARSWCGWLLASPRHVWGSLLPSSRLQRWVAWSCLSSVLWRRLSCPPSALWFLCKMRSLVLETQPSLADTSAAIVSLATAGEVGWPDGAGMSEEQRGRNPVFCVLGLHYLQLSPSLPGGIWPGRGSLEAPWIA